MRGMLPWAETITMPRISWPVLLSLVAMMFVSVLTFNWQVRRWTGNPRWRALSDWARERGFRLSHPQSMPTAPLDQLRDARMAVLLQAKQTRIIQLESGSGSAVATPRWHLLVRGIAPAWAPTGLRPVNAAASLLDLYALTSFPTLGQAGRFTMFGASPAAARTLSRSSIAGLLPPDVGLLLAGNFLVLDFSARPFDSIEFGRMVALVEQLVSHLPAIKQ